MTPPEQALSVDLTGASYGGRMIGRVDGRVTFVAGGVPTETVQAQITTARKNFAEARALHIIGAPSPLRAEPHCDLFGENGDQRGSLTANRRPGPVCGGCQYQHLTSDAQVALKQTILADTLRRIGQISPTVLQPPIASPLSWGYRNKVRWVVLPDGQTAYRAADSHTPVPTADCAIAAPPLRRLLAALQHPTARGALADVSDMTARCAPVWAPHGSSTDESVAVVLHGVRPLTEADVLPLVDVLRDQGCTLASVHTAPPGGTAEQSDLLWGADSLDTMFAGCRYHIHPLCFWQVNTTAAELLVDHVLGLLGDLAGGTVLELYSGAGTFTLPMLRRGARVIAMERDERAMRDAQHSAVLNNLDGLIPHLGDVDDELDVLHREAIERVVVDPPRSGLGGGVVAALGRLAARSLVYVSCDPATLARDARALGHLGYQLRQVTLVDLFPQTARLEAVALLEHEP